MAKQKDTSFYASTDPLTSNYNRRKFFVFADKYRATALRNEHPLSLLALDLDHFKYINDEFGHAASDKVLIDFTRLIGSLLRESDVFARFDGEEFAILLENSSAKKCRKRGRNHYQSRRQYPL